MENIKTSPFKIERIILQQVEFTRILSECDIVDIPIDAISIDVEADPISETNGRSCLNLAIYKYTTNPHPFEFRVKYEMIFTLNDANLMDAFKMFLNVGAPFNLLVYTRDLLMSLTNKAYNKTIILPLLDIREFALLVAKNPTPKEDEGERSAQENSPDSLPKE
jgi:preprotein translocase subunit SecB